MSHYDYSMSMELSIQDPPFYALIMAAMRKADDDNLARLRSMFPQTFKELKARRDAPRGLLPEELKLYPPQ